MVRIINWKQIVCLHSMSAMLVNFIENNSKTVEEGSGDAHGVCEI